ncbi:MAG: hypothetical protein B6D61_01190 [Bacteroidetes bacterium 4484_249]|nr:MAG: hypothetical protein B6D61_01190 [Bacteroidetes bacterium 4484_249]
MRTPGRSIILILLVLSSSQFVFSQGKNLIILPDTTYEISDPDFELLLTASEGDTTKLKALLEIGADINYSTYDGVTPLMYAAQNGHLRTIEILIDSGAKINAMPENRVSALLGACIAGYVYVADTLILNGANVNTQNFDGVTPLMYAAAYNDTIMADMLLFYNAKTEQQDFYGNTALLYSVYYGNFELTGLLTNHGANIECADNNGFTPLMVASQNEHIEIVKYLIQNGANIDTTNRAGLNALSYAIINGNYELTNYLLENGANARYSISKSRNQLGLAREFGRQNISSLLIEYGAEKNSKPQIDKLTIGIDLNGNRNDFMLGGNISLIESKYGVQLQLGYKTRLSVKSVMYESNSNIYYQFWELRSCVHFGLDKMFVLLRPSVNSFGGAFVGINGTYTYGSFRGSDRKPDDKFLMEPKAGIFLNSNNFILKLNYEYMKLTNSKVSPHRFNFTIGFIINFSKNKIIIKKEPEF